jgi:hypothetical protein
MSQSKTFSEKSKKKLSLNPLAAKKFRAASKGQLKAREFGQELFVIVLILINSAAIYP